ncbi:MAG: RusA family crossover junction endodeoxyribonuclease [Ruminococcus sp.]
MSSTTPDKTVLYENFIATRYMEAAGEQRFSDGAYIKARIRAFYEIPKSSSKVKKTAMLSGELLPTKKPDIDNIVKAVLDALTEVAYRHDTQVMELQVRKQYKAKDQDWRSVWKNWRLNHIWQGGNRKEIAFFAWMWISSQTRR